MSKLENKQYFFWELLQKVGIKIPIIQRDYAQGRKNKQVEDVRESFLNSLLEVLVNDEKLIDLDFVYGTVKNDYLVPLDGQQRLTTLFLLHYFLALKDDKLDTDNKKILEKFTYETRLSSREFIELLINKQIELEDKLISTTIKNQTWFFSDWEKDPTIRGMLIMLDSIQAKFKNIGKGFFEKLLSEKKITFSFLDLDEFKLTDELYIKMNARGKPLTEFENFKSKFESFIPDINTKAKLDNDWYDIFWKIGLEVIEKKKEEENPGQEADKLFLNFFTNMTAFYNKKLNKVDIFKFKYNFPFIKKWSEKNPNDLNILFQIKTPISDLVNILDCLTNYKDNETDQIRTDLNFFEFFLKEAKDISYAERLKFYILMVFFLKKGLPSNNQNIFKSWVRVNINIINNTAYDKIDDFNNNVKFINKIGKHIDDLYNFLSKYSTTDKISDQLKEEIEKAKIITKNKDTDWEKQFIEAEQHSYLDGEIKFLIGYAEDEEKLHIKKFEEYRDKFKTLWDFATRDKDNKILLHRALLTFGNYLPKQKNNNKYTFGSFGEGLREKNENWRKIFKSTEFKALLDRLNYKNIKEELDNIINSFEFNCNDWKSYFINPNKGWTPILYANNYHIKIDNKNKIFLNNGWSNSGATGWGWSRVYEMYSIYLLQNIKKELNEEYKPFLNIDSHSSSDIKELYPHISIAGWLLKGGYSFKLDIIYEQENLFIVEFFEINDKQIPNKIISILENREFQTDDETYDTRIYKNIDFKICDQNKLIVFLKELFNMFQEVSNDPI